MKIVCISCFDANGYEVKYLCADFNHLSKEYNPDLIYCMVPPKKFPDIELNRDVK